MDGQAYRKLLCLLLSLALSTISTAGTATAEPSLIPQKQRHTVDFQRSTNRPDSPDSTLRLMSSPDGTLRQVSNHVSPDNPADTITLAQPFIVEASRVHGPVTPEVQAQLEADLQEQQHRDDTAGAARALLHGSKRPAKYPRCARCRIVRCSGRSCSGHCRRNRKLRTCDNTSIARPEPMPDLQRAPEYEPAPPSPDGRAPCADQEACDDPGSSPGSTSPPASQQEPPLPPEGNGSGEPAPPSPGDDAPCAAPPRSLEDVRGQPPDAIGDYDTVVVTAEAPFIGCADIANRPSGCPARGTRATLPGRRVATVIASICRAEFYAPECGSPVLPAGVCECTYRELRRRPVRGASRRPAGARGRIVRAPCSTAALEPGSGVGGADGSPSDDGICVKPNGDFTQTWFSDFLDPAQRPEFAYQVNASARGVEVQTTIEIYPAQIVSAARVDYFSDYTISEDYEYVDESD